MVGQRLGHFEILEKLGAGGMGEVYKARDSRLDRIVAIKVLPPDFTRDGAAVHRLQREARLVASLSHPHICPLFEVGHENGTDFLVMEYLEGETLAERLTRGKLPLALALRYGVQIAGAVAAAHTAGIIHRDLKPGNVMLTKSGSRLLDFGVAKQREVIPLDDEQPTRSLQTNTAAGTISGTVGYMSPEQAEGKPVDTRSDIFSFGSLLYEMASGQRAFRGDSNLATLAAILEKDPAPLASELPTGLRKIISRCLRKNPDERYQHISDVRIALEELEDDAKSRPSTDTSARQRTRTGWVAGALAALALVALALGWWANRGVDGDPPVVIRGGTADQRGRLRREPELFARWQAGGVFMERGESGQLRHLRQADRRSEAATADDGSGRRSQSGLLAGRSDDRLHSGVEPSQELRHDSAHRRQRASRR